MTSLWIMLVDGMPVQICRSEAEAVALLEQFLADEEFEQEDISDLPYESGACFGPYSIYELKVGKYYDPFVDDDDDEADGKPVPGPARP